MQRNRVRSPHEALVYMIECTLATVEYMAGLKRPARNEFLRQCNIAQQGLEWLKEFEVPCDGRPADYLGKNVLTQANEYRVKCGLTKIKDNR